MRDSFHACRRSSFPRRRRQRTGLWPKPYRQQQYRRGRHGPMPCGPARSPPNRSTPFPFNRRSHPSRAQRRWLPPASGESNQIGDQRIDSRVIWRLVERHWLAHDVSPCVRRQPVGSSSGAIVITRSRNAARARVSSDSAALSVTFSRAAMSRTETSSRYFHSSTLP